VIENIENEIIQKLESVGIKTISEVITKTNLFQKIRIEDIVAFVNPPISIEYEKIENVYDNHVLLNITFPIYILVQNLQSNIQIKRKFYSTIEKLHLLFQRFQTEGVIQANIKNLKFEDFDEETNIMVYSLDLVIKAHKKGG